MFQQQYIETVGRNLSSKTKQRDLSISRETLQHYWNMPPIEPFLYETRFISRKFNRSVGKVTTPNPNRKVSSNLKVSKCRTAIDGK